MHLNKSYKGDVQMAKKMAKKFTRKQIMHVIKHVSYSYTVPLSKYILLLLI